MVRLKNIQLKDNCIQCDYYIESYEERGFIKMDINTLEIVEHIEAKPKYQEWLKHGVRFIRTMAFNKRENKISESDIPKEKTIIWY